MKFTNSKDGKERTNLVFKIRLTREELKEFNMQAKKTGKGDFKNFVDGELMHMTTRLQEDFDFENEE